MDDLNEAYLDRQARQELLECGESLLQQIAKKGTAGAAPYGRNIDCRLLSPADPRTLTRKSLEDESLTWKWMPL